MSGLTIEQANASDPMQSVWVGASAGTGKTHVLTARVLRLMLRGHDPAKILCLTYTKAAAAEMKNRILTTLGSWSTMSDASLAIAINETTGEAMDAELKDKARQLFAEVLELPGGLKIQTIHSFCQSILSRFPLEAGLTPGFEVAEDGESQELLRIARDRVFQAIVGKGASRARTSLERIASRTAEQTFDSVIKGLIGKADVLREIIRRYGTIDEAIVALREYLGLGVGDTRDEVIISALSDEAINHSLIKSLADAMTGTNKTMTERADKILTVLALQEDDRIKYFDLYLSAFLTASMEARKDEKSKLFKSSPDLSTINENEKERLHAVVNKLRTIELAENTGALIRIGLMLLEDYEQIKHNRGKLDFNDIIDNTENLFALDAITPWILYKLDEGIDHILVDEAQDTNAQQWAIIEALASEFYQQEDDGAPPRTMFAVGDPKQSIYSFQKAEPKEFETAKTRIFKQAKAAKYTHEAVPLHLSFRTSEAVLTVVDAVFDKQGMAYEGLTFDGAEIEHKYHRRGQAGKFELWPLTVPEEKPLIRPWEPPIVQETGVDASERLAAEIARNIRHLLDNGTVLPATRKPVTAGDILILVQRRSSFVDSLIAELRKQDVAVAGRDRMKLSEELVVEDLLAAVSFALQPEDDLTLACLLKSPLIGMEEEALFGLCYGRGAKSIWTRLKEKSDEHHQIVEFLKSLLQRADQIPVYEFYATLLNQQGGREKMVRRLGPEVHETIDEFLEMTLQYERVSPASLQGFIAYFQENSGEIKRDMEKTPNEVRIMTVHGAKGLQAPVVVLPDTVRVPSQQAVLFEAPDSPLFLWKLGKTMASEPHLMPLQAKEEAERMAEYRRLLYVAMTRAEDHLIVCGWETQHKRKDNCWYSLIEQGLERLIGEQDSDQVRKYEVEQSAPLKRSDLVEGIAPDFGPVPKWVFSKPLPESSTSRPLIPSQQEDDGPVARRSPLDHVDERRFTRGILIHKLLEWLPDVPDGEKVSAAKRFLTKSAFGLREREQDLLLEEVMSIVSDNTFAPIFCEGSRAEVSLSGLVGDELIVGQVDRLVVTDQKVLIVDYKTNRPVPSELSSVPLAYIKQMRAYARALREIYPDHKLEAAILWTDEAKLMALPSDLVT